MVNHSGNGTQKKRLHTMNVGCGRFIPLLVKFFSNGLKGLLAGASGAKWP